MSKAKSHESAWLVQGPLRILLCWSTGHTAETELKGRQQADREMRDRASNNLEALPCLGKSD